MNQLATTGSILLGALSHISLVCLSQGLSTEALLSIVTGVSGNLVSDMLQGLLQGKAKNWLFRTHPNDLNHSIKRLFVSSIDDALSNIHILYEESGLTSQEKREAKRAFKKLKQALHSKAEDIIKSASIDDLHINNFIHSGYADTSVTSYLLRELEGCDLSPKLRSFIAQHYPTQIQLCFGEGLKSPANHEAWVAYQRLMSDELRDLLQGLQAEQREIREDLKDLKLGQGIDPEQMKELRRLGDLLSDPKQFELHLSDLRPVAGETRGVSKSLDPDHDRDSPHGPRAQAAPAGADQANQASPIPHGLSTPSVLDSCGSYDDSYSSCPLQPNDPDPRLAWQGPHPTTRSGEYHTLHGRENLSGRDR